VGLTASLLRFTAARPHVLLVPTAGGTAARLACEAEMARRGWPAATSPAGTDLLVVAGSPGQRMGEVADALWARIPAPRARVEVGAAAEAAALLEAAAADLADPTRQRASVTPPPMPDEHGHLGSGGGDMEMPGGLPMADLGEDRDGLALDRLHLPLGPVLPDWPAGLVLRVVLQGDVIQEAGAEVVDPGGGSRFWTNPDHAPARELDGLARFLAVAGWADAAAGARRIRDELLAGTSHHRVAEPTAALVRRVRRARTLRWLVRGIGAGQVDVAVRLEQRLAAVEAAVAAPGAQPAPRGTVDVLPELLVGAELAAARLIVAVLDPDTEPAEPRQEVARHG
jgi:hypothetical protein